MIDIHAHVTDNLQQRLTQDAELGVEITILSATRVHPERAHTVAQVRAEFESLQQVISGAPSAGSFEPARIELQHAVESAPTRTRALAAAPLCLRRRASGPAMGWCWTGRGGRRRSRSGSRS